MVRLVLALVVALAAVAVAGALPVGVKRSQRAGARAAAAAAPGAATKSLLDQLQGGLGAAAAQDQGDQEDAMNEWRDDANQDNAAAEEQDLPEAANDALFPGDPTQPTDPSTWDNTDDTASDTMAEAMARLLNRTYAEDAVVDVSSGYLEPDTVDLAYQLLKTSSDALRAAGVPFWAERGTLLGGVREGGMLPWALANDLGVPLDRRDAVRRILPALAKIGVCAVEPASGTVTLSWCRGPHATSRDPATRQKYTFPLLRLWYLAWDGDRLAGSTEAGWPATCAHLRAEFEPTGKVRVGPLTLAAGGHPEAYLARCFGKRWRSVAQAHTGGDAALAPPAAGDAYDNATDAAAAAAMNSFGAHPSLPLFDMLTPAALREILQK